MNKKISAIIITYNEEDVISDCIKSLKDFCEEIILVDSYSEDNTCGIAKKLGAKVIQHKFENFSSQRNFALTQVRGDFVLLLDADERANKDFEKEIAKIVDEYTDSSKIGGWFIRRKTYYFNKDWGMSDQVQRFFARNRIKGWFGIVHETPEIDGDFGRINSPISHFTHRNLSQMITKTNKWSGFEADLRYKANHPKMSPWRFIRVMVTEFYRSYVMDNGYKNGTYGIIESTYQAYSMFITYAKLWELQNKK